MQTSSEEEKQCDTGNHVPFGYFCQARVAKQLYRQHKVFMWAIVLRGEYESLLFLIYNYLAVDGSNVFEGRLYVWV